MKKIGIKIYLVSLVGIFFLSFINIALIYYFRGVANIVEQQINADSAVQKILKINAQVGLVVGSVVRPEINIANLKVDFDYLMAEFDDNLKQLGEVKDFSPVHDQLVKDFNSFKNHSEEIFTQELTIREKRHVLSNIFQKLNSGLINFSNINLANEGRKLYFDLKDAQRNFEVDTSNRTEAQNWRTASDNMGEYLHSKKIVDQNFNDYLDLQNQTINLASEIHDNEMALDFHLGLIEENKIDIGFYANRIVQLSNEKYDRIIKQNESRFNQSIISVFAALIATMLFAFFIVRNIVDPINKLSEAAQGVVNGNLKVRADVTTNDEIGYLASVFNEMLSEIEIFQKTVKENQNNLKKLNASLESRIAERTKELQGIKDNLEVIVKERTSELQSKLNELEKFRDLTVGREVKMISLKKEIEELKKKLK